MLVPFHYHGISEIIVNGESISDVSSFSYLTCDERVRHIIHYADLYGSDDERVKGVVFCRNVEEAKALAKAFVEHGKRAVALCGEDSESVRMDAVHRLEAPLQDPHRLEYILHVIFSMKASTYHKSIRLSCSGPLNQPFSLYSNSAVDSVNTGTNAIWRSSISSAITKIISFCLSLYTGTARIAKSSSVTSCIRIIFRGLHRSTLMIFLVIAYLKPLMKISFSR